ncbi:MAG: SAVED domain-containing protein [Thermoanaerobaculia bacterium]
MPALAAAQEGARYQYRFFWRLALPMLYLDAPPLIERVVMEHRAVDAVDDVVVYYTTPGLAESGRLVRVDYHQIKFHVAQGQCIASVNLIDPAWTGTTHSMLWRFAAAWKELRQEEENLRLNLVTNWPWCPADPLAPLIRDGGMLEENFFTKGPTSKVGKARQAWRSHLSLLTDAEFGDFIRQLRLCVRAVSQGDAGEWLADRCQLAGLQRPDLAASHSPYDDLAGRLLADGRREFTRAELAALLEQEKLIAEPVAPYRSACAVKSFRRFAHVPQADAKVVVDLTDLFAGRDPIDAAVWPTTVPSRLGAALDAISALPQPVQLALDTHLSIGWYVGTLLDAKAGIPSRLRQKSYGGVELWDTTSPTPDAEQAWQVGTEAVGDGNDIAVAISITHDVADDVRAALSSLAPNAGTLIRASLPKLGPAAIRGGAHACALADDLARILRSIARERNASRAHVFAACPVSFAFLLGQRSAAVGPMTMYE